MPNANVNREYRAIRRKHPELPASQAIIWSRSILTTPEHGWDTDREGSGLVATWEQDGFTLTAHA